MMMMMCRRSRSLKVSYTIIIFLFFLFYDFLVWKFQHDILDDYQFRSDVKGIASSVYSYRYVGQQSTDGDILHLIVGSSIEPH